jgi:hypothetical protein
MEQLLAELKHHHADVAGHIVGLQSRWASIT